MKILIIGAGAVGSYIGAHLARSGQWVTFVDRKQSLDALNLNGVGVRYPDGTAWQTTNLHTAGTIEQAMKGFGWNHSPFDVVFLCVKAYSLDEVINDLVHCEMVFHQPAESRCTLLVALQNGIGNEERLAGVFGAKNIIAATTTSPVSLHTPGIVQVERAGGSICFAPLDPAANDLMHRRSFSKLDGNGNPGVFTQMCQTIQRTTLQMKVYADYRSLKWSKLLLNMMGNATSAILDLTPEQVYADPRLYTFEMQMLHEAYLVMRKLGVQPMNLPHFPAATLTYAMHLLPWRLLQPVLASRLAQGRGAKRPSFYYDIEKQTGNTEVGWLNGAVARYGQECGIPVPVNRRLCDVLLGMVSGTYTRAEWRENIHRLVSL